MSEKRSQSAASSFVFKLLESFGNQGIAFVVSLVLGRLLTPDDYGVLSLLLVFTAIAQVFVQSGLNTALIQRAEIDETDRSSVFFLGLAIAALLYTALFFAAPAIERYFAMVGLASYLRVLALILFPVIVTVVAGVVVPMSAPLVGSLMFGNLIRECGVLDSLSDTAQHVLANLITILLGITIACQMKAEQFLRPDTLLILGLGLVAFIMDTAGGVLFAKFLNLFLKEKINPMIGAAGISAFPMSGRIVHKMGLKEDPSNFLLMHSIGVNVSGQIASVIAGGLVLTLVPMFLK